MKGSAKQIEGSKLVISHLESSRIGIAVLERRYRQAFIRGRMRNQFNHGLKRRERFASPIDRNVGKESVLDRIPFAGRRRIMGNGNGKLFFIGKILQLLFPQSVSHAVGPTPISGDEKLLFVGIERFA